MRACLAILLAASLLGQALPFWLGGYVPASGQEFPGLHSPEYETASRAFNAPFRIASLCRAATGILVLAWLLASGAPTWLERRMNDKRLRWPLLAGSLLGLSLLLLAARLPYAISAYHHARIFGILTCGPLSWLGDLLKSFSLGALLSCGQYLLLYCMMGISPRRWWLTGGLMVFVLFNLASELLPMRPRDPVRTLTPITDGPFYEALNGFAEKQGLSMRFFTDDTSRRGETVNAYLGGRDANRYMVFSDTFLARFTPQEAVLAVAHELGHLQNQWRFLALRGALSLAALLVAFYAAARGAGPPPHGARALLACMLSLSVISFLLAPAFNAVDRLDERLADRHALQMAANPADYEQLLSKGAMINLEEPCPPRLYSTLFVDHPRLCDRLKMVAE